MRAVKHLLTAREKRNSRILNAGKMVHCTVCGVYLPENEATVLEDEKFKCRSHD
jgi:Pyruvate/2-oxoacid:ferredoxin oxidoreductase delta subunit